ncbi:hypothetical protein MASR1M32_05620 [Rhodobacter sp.]
MVRAFLGDPKAQLSAALRALGGEPSQDDAHTLQKRLKRWSATYAPVFWYPMAKPSGGHRPICILPPDLKAMHHMVAAAIAAQLPDTPTLYGIRGRGTPEALRELKALQNAGFVHLAKTDIVDCFQSIDPDALYQLPLPEEVIRRAFDPRNLTFTQGDHRNASQAICRSSLLGHIPYHLAGGPSGLLQGSPASSVILAWLLKDIPTSDDARVMLCFDNIVVAARTPDGTRELIETLTAYLGNSPAGPLALCDPTFADNEPLEFMGGLFDPLRRDIGLAEGTLRRIETRLRHAEDADSEVMAGLREEHQRLCAENAIFQCLNPLQGFYPTDIWQVLRDARAGLPFVDDDCPDLMQLLEVAAVTVDMRGDWLTSGLHRRLFDRSATDATTAIRHIMNAHPRPPKGRCQC